MTGGASRALAHGVRRLIFGGVTEHMLFKTDIPALMLHR